MREGQLGAALHLLCRGGEGHGQRAALAVHEALRGHPFVAAGQHVVQQRLQEDAVRNDSDVLLRQGAQELDELCASLRDLPQRLPPLFVVPGVCAAAEIETFAFTTPRCPGVAGTHQRLF